MAEFPTLVTWEHQGTIPKRWRRLPGINWSKLLRFRWNIYLVCVLLAAFVLLALILMSVSDAVGRYVFLAPLPGATEIAQQMMAYIVFLAYAYVLARGEHIRVTFFVDKLPRKLGIGTQILAGLLGLFFSVLIFWGSLQQFWSAYELQEIMLSLIKLPWWPAKLGMPIGFFLLAIEFLVYLVSRVRELVLIPGSHGRGLDARQST